MCALGRGGLVVGECFWGEGGGNVYCVFSCWCCSVVVLVVGCWLCVEGGDGVILMEFWWCGCLTVRVFDESLKNKRLNKNV